MNKIIIVSVIFFLLSSLSCGGSPGAEGADWIQWAGPNRIFSSNETGYNPQAFSDGVKVFWESDVGRGLFSAGITDCHLYTTGEPERNKTTVFCINVKNGKVHWSAVVQTKPVYQTGTAAHATPAIDGQHIYVFGPNSDVFCLAATNGEIIWQVILEDGNEMRPPKYGHAYSPIVVG